MEVQQSHLSSKPRVDESTVFALGAKPSVGSVDGPAFRGGGVRHFGENGVGLPPSFHVHEQIYGHTVPSHHVLEVFYGESNVVLLLPVLQFLVDEQPFEGVELYHVRGGLLEFFFEVFVEDRVPLERSHAPFDEYAVGAKICFVSSFQIGFGHVVRVERMRAITPKYRVRACVNGMVSELLGEPEKVLWFPVQEAQLRFQEG